MLVYQRVPPMVFCCLKNRSLVAGDPSLDGSVPRFDKAMSSEVSTPYTPTNPNILVFDIPVNLVVPYKIYPFTQPISPNVNINNFNNFNTSRYSMLFVCVS